jgi:hypothetical protein
VIPAAVVAAAAAAEGGEIQLGHYKGDTPPTTRLHSTNGIMYTTDVKIDIDVGGRPKNDSEVNNLQRLELGRKPTKPRRGKKL